MKKRICLLACAALLMAGCHKEPAPTEPSLNVPPASTAAATEPAVTETVPEASEEGTLAGVVQEYLTPVEDYSWDREYAPEYVMIHFSSNVVNNRENPYILEEVRKNYTDYGVSAHYLIDREGGIHCLIPEDRAAWHAGEGTFLNDEKYTDRMNLYSIGIELMGIGTKDEMKDYLTAEEYDALDPSLIGFTDAQYEALWGLTEDICRRNSIPFDADHIIGHQDYAETSTDPGRLFDWNRLLG